MHKVNLPKKHYQSGIDYWLLIVILFIVFYGLYDSWKDVGFTISMQTLINTGIYVAALLVVYCFMYTSTWPCDYCLEEHGLRVRCGRFMKDFIPYTDIQSCTKTYNPAGAPALSLKRLAIRHDNGVMLISPVNRDEFLHELQNRIRG